MELCTDIQDFIGICFHVADDWQGSVKFRYTVSGHYLLLLKWKTLTDYIGYTVSEHQICVLNLLTEAE